MYTYVYETRVICLGLRAKIFNATTPQHLQTRIFVGIQYKQIKADQPETL